MTNIPLTINAYYPLLASILLLSITAIGAIGIFPLQVRQGEESGVKTTLALMRKTLITIIALCMIALVIHAAHYDSASGISLWYIIGIPFISWLIGIFCGKDVRD